MSTTLSIAMSNLRSRAKRAIERKGEAIDRAKAAGDYELAETLRADLLTLHGDIEATYRLETADKTRLRRDDVY